MLEGHGTPAYTSVDGLPWWNPDTVIEDADLDGARKLLEEAGWKDTDGDGILEKDALKAEFTFITQQVMQLDNHLRFLLLI